jgi:peptidoglycan/LPS O-acetylase OafA/YrhL
MSLTLALDLVVCGGLLAGMSFLAQHVQPEFPRLTFFTGLVGGGLCILWGFLGRRGIRCRGNAMTTLAVAACVFAYQAVPSWGAWLDWKPEDRKVLLLMTISVVFCVGMLANLFQDGKGLQP